MDATPNYVFAFGSYTKPATLSPKRDLTINIKRENTNQTNISIELMCSTDRLGYLDDVTTDVMHHMLTYHDISFDAATTIVADTDNHVYTIVSRLADYQATDLHVIVNITDYNPLSTNRIDVDITISNWEAAIRAPAASEEDGVCTICFEKIRSGGYVNSLACNHVFHHQCICDWIRSNLSCPTCRHAII